jgi:hypothetical protein
VWERVPRALRLELRPALERALNAEAHREQGIRERIDTTVHAAEAIGRIRGTPALKVEEKDLLSRHILEELPGPLPAHQLNVVVDGNMIDLEVRPSFDQIHRQPALPPSVSETDRGHD